MADPELVTPADNFDLIENGKPTLVFYTWMDAITRVVNNLAPLTGSGSPEGVQEARSGRWYVDISAPAGSGIYFKETGDGNTGWILRS